MKRFRYDMGEAIRYVQTELRPDLLGELMIHSFGGSGGGGDTIDKAYNARMATVAEDYKDLFKDDHDFYTKFYQPMEKEQIAANRELIPLETSLQKATLQSQQDLLPGQTALTKASNEAALSLIPGQTELASKELDYQSGVLDAKKPVMNAFFQESLDGVDAEARANKAGADVAQEFDTSNAILGRNAARMGINPNSGRFAGMSNSTALERAKAVASAKTTARTNAESENYQRLNNAMGY